MITNHTELLNALETKYNLTRYLEIGVQNKANNYNHIICENKTGVDPEVNDSEIRGITSDEYFAAIANNKPKVLFDLIFIDGLHHEDQVKRDFENSLLHLSEHGYIVIHDTLPENEAGTLVPRATKQWWGDVYKWAMRLQNYGGIKFITFNIDNGCTVIHRDPAHICAGTTIVPNWDNFKSVGWYLLNVKNEVAI